MKTDHTHTRFPRSAPRKLALYIWRPTFLRDHTDGLAVALAASLDDAIDVIAKAYAGKQPARRGLARAVWFANYDRATDELRANTPEIKRGRGAVLAYGGG